MKVSLKWLRQYVNITIAPEDLAHKLTMVGLEIEDIEHLGVKYEKFVVGKVLEVSKHPKADKLTVCKVDVGSEVLQIVCGAPNVAPNQIVPVGLSGAVVPHNQHDPDGKPFTLSNVKLRGIESFGMICSAHELGLGDDKDGIMVFDSDAKVGTPLAEFLGQNDIVFEVGITPNRADALSHIGIAREIAALLDEKLTLPKFEVQESNKKTSEHASIIIEDAENCPRYSGRVLSNVKIAESPKWLQNFLNAVGIRPVNNIVDVTNYVLMEFGQPLHAFDYDTLTGHKIVVKCAKEGEKFTTLDHKERTLKSDTLMICDGEKNIAVAGVMGGENTEITNSTINVLLESAYFNPTSIRRTAKYLGLSSDASQRFERGANPNITTVAIDRAAQLIQELCGAEVLQGVIDVYPQTIQPRVVPLRVSRTNQLLGTTLDKKTVSNLLKKIELTPLPSKHTSNDDTIEFEVPTFRVDLEREIDLIEEVARVYGYDNIQTDVSSRFSFSSEPPKRDFENELREWFVGRGIHEAVINSMNDIETAKLSSSEFVEVANPISKDMATLRTSLLTGLLQCVRSNLFHGTKTIRLFEFGRVYFKENPTKGVGVVSGFYEEDRLALILSGLSEQRHWDGRMQKVDIFELKGELEACFGKVFLDNYQFIPYPIADSLVESGLTVEVNGKKLGKVGKIRADILKRYEIEQDVFVAELNVTSIEQNKRLKNVYQSLPKYPSVMRDIAVVVDEQVPAGKLMEEITSVGGSLLKQVELFDIYRGDQLTAGKKSCAIALEFNSEEHTLTQEEIDKQIQLIVKQLSVVFNASLRT